MSVSVGACGGVMGAGCGGGPEGVLVVLCREGAPGVDGARACADPWVCSLGFCFGVGLGSARTELAGHLLDVGRHRGREGERGRCWLSLASLRSSLRWSVGLGCRF